MGVTSAGIVALAQKIKNEIDEDFDPTVLFEKTNVGLLANCLVDNYPDFFGRVVVKKVQIEIGTITEEESSSNLNTHNNTISTEENKDQINPNNVLSFLRRLESGSFDLDEMIEKLQ